MPKSVDTAEVERLIERGAQVIEVLPASAYEREHLPGARNLPLDSMQPDAVADFDLGLPTIVYCYDYQCDLSARGAHRLETLGFTDVYHYTASKAAWLASGLPVEGTVPAASRAGSIARRDVPRCSLGEKVGDVRERFDDAGLCVVVDDEDVVLGVVREEVTGLPDETLVDEVLQPGPPTARPSITADELARNLDQDARPHILVTTLEGRLVGLIRRTDLHGQH
jgi:rhodanese-related sulfurtransferase/CBS domain-containing protein